LDKKEDKSGRTHDFEGTIKENRIKVSTCKRGDRETDSTAKHQKQNKKRETGKGVGEAGHGRETELQKEDGPKIKKKDRLLNRGGQGRRRAGKTRMKHRIEQPKKKQGTKDQAIVT